MSDSEDLKKLDHVDMTVRELLTEMKDISEVMVDLAYASLMYNSESMAEKVHELEEEMDNLKFAVRYKVLLSCRTKEDARQLSGLLQVASAADRISDAAGDIVDLLDVPLEKRPFVSKMLYESDEKIRAAKIGYSSGMVGYTIGDLAVEACTGCKIIAIKGRQGWIYDPEDDVKVRSGDDIVVRGTEDGYNHLLEFTVGKIPWEFPEESDEEMEEAEEEAENLEDEERDE
jgi:uncharacterized protein with PhoU and TrkA domain